MKYQRKFIIKIIINLPWHNENSYVKDFIKNSIGYYHLSTHNLENAKIWRYRKTCENSINMVLSKHDPTKNIMYFSKDSFEIIEITDNQTLRSIKLNKINKSNQDEI